MQIYQWFNRTKDRFYQITVKQNSMSNITLNYDWGSCNSNRRGHKNVILHSEEEVKKTIQNMMKRRKNRGYEFVASFKN